jgi:hypothetical protein
MPRGDAGRPRWRRRHPWWRREARWQSWWRRGAGWGPGRRWSPGRRRSPRRQRRWGAGWGPGRWRSPRRQRRRGAGWGPGRWRSPRRQRRPRRRRRMRRCCRRWRRPRRRRRMRRCCRWRHPRRWRLRRQRVALELLWFGGSVVDELLQPTALGRDICDGRGIDSRELRRERVACRADDRVDGGEHRAGRLVVAEAGGGGGDERGDLRGALVRAVGRGLLRRQAGQARSASRLA